MLKMRIISFVGVRGALLKQLINFFRVHGGPNGPRNNGSTAYEEFTLANNQVNHRKRKTKNKYERV